MALHLELRGIFYLWVIFNQLSYCFSSFTPSFSRNSVPRTAAHLFMEWIAIIKKTKKKTKQKRKQKQKTKNNNNNKNAHY